MSDVILAVVEQSEGRLNPISWETLTAAQILANDLQSSVEAAVLGSGVNHLAKDIARLKLNTVYDVESPRLERYTPDAFCFALKQLISQTQPRLVLMPHTYQVRDLAPKLAVQLGRGLVSDATGYKKEGDDLLFTRQIFQGKFTADVCLAGEPPHFISVQPGAFRGDQVVAGPSLAPVEVISLNIPQDIIRTQPEEVCKEAKQTVDLTQAEIVVGVGRGIKEQKNIELAKQLADVLGAELGASRPICDSGWLPLDRQVGSSGQTVSPKLYMALGISGAIQHLIGMKGSRTIIAVNKDPEAPIFEVADYAVISNLFDVVPPLIEEIKKLKAGCA